MKFSMSSVFLLCIAGRKNLRNTAVLYRMHRTDSTDYLTISGFTSLNGLICLHSVLDKAGSQSVFKRTQNPRIFIHSFILLARPRWLRGTVVERRSMTGELSLCYARPTADG